MNLHYSFVARRAGHRCEYCHAPEALFNFPFEVEHIIPTSCGGTEKDGNLALACRACNVHKANHLKGLVPPGNEEVLLFHPRKDRWEENFKVDQETGTVIGLTPIGQATVERLRMNSAVQLQARRQWMLLGLFP